MSVELGVIHILEKQITAIKDLHFPSESSSQAYKDHLACFKNYAREFQPAQLCTFKLWHTPIIPNTYNSYRFSFFFLKENKELTA